MNVTVVGSSGDLLAFARMDAVQKSDAKYLLSLDGVIASRGGIPLVEDGKLVGAIGCSGGNCCGAQ